MEEVSGETLSEAQGLVTPKKQRMKERIHVTYSCANCGTTFERAKHPETGQSQIFKCGGGCDGHYLCSNTCMAADWEKGHYKVCLRGRVRNE